MIKKNIETTEPHTVTREVERDVGRLIREVQRNHPNRKT